MEKKISKGLIKVLFAPKSNSGCCNVQFEEITDEKDLTNKETQNNENKENASS
jgi:hypothetical protein